MSRKLVISLIILLFLVLITNRAFALPFIYVDSFEAFPPTIYTNGNGTVEGGTSYGATAAGGVSVATIAIANSTAENSEWDCLWGDFSSYSSAQEYQFWQMHGHLVGDPGEEAEIIFNWRFWTQPLVFAMIDNIFLDTATASARSHMNGYVDGVNKDGYFNDLKDGYSDVYFEVLDEQRVNYFGVKGDEITKTGSVSLGIFPVGDPYYFTISAFLGVSLESYVHTVGEAKSLLFTTSNFTLTPKTENEPIPVPIPGTVWLLGSGLLGLIVLRRKKG